MENDASEMSGLADDAAHLLVIDDDTRIRNLLKQYLSENGFRVTVAGSADEARRKLQGLDFDLLIMDVMMPGESGIDMTRSLREDSKKQIPILMLTALSETDSRITGLQAGADDYLAKPFHMEELLARLRALIRRSAGQADNLLRCGPLQLDLRSNRAQLNGQELALTHHEFLLLSCLLRQAGRVVSRSELTEQIYPLDSERDSNTIEVFVARLRKKLPEGMIETQRGFGYRLVAPDNTA